MNLADTELTPLQVGKIRNAGFHTVEELPDTEEGLTAIKGIGATTARQILEIKQRVATAKGPPPTAAESEEPPPAAEPEEAPPAEEDPEVFPTAVLTRYHCQCLAALDRQLGRELPRWVYTYLVAIGSGRSRKEATQAAGQTGAIQTDREAFEAVKEFALHYTLVQSRAWGPAPGSVP